MSYEVLKKELKENKLRNIYLFYGVEDYLKNFHLNQIENMTITEELKSFNYLFLDESSVSPQAIVDFCESLPVMCDKKLLVIKKTNLLKSKKSSSGINLDGLMKYFEDIPDYVCIIFVEANEIDKRSSLYKYIEKSGLTVEFGLQKRDQLSNWIERVFKENGKSIGKDEILYIVDNADTNMQSILNECNKIIDYCFDKKSISLEDVKSIITHSLTFQVFEMIDETAQKNLKKALIMLNEMLILKEPTPRILSLIAWRIKIMLQAKVLLKEGLSQNEIAKRTGAYFISKCIKQSDNFSIEKLEELMYECSIADVKIKTSAIEDRIILEELIIKIAG